MTHCCTPTDVDSFLFPFSCFLFDHHQGSISVGDDLGVMKERTGSVLGFQLHLLYLDTPTGSLGHGEFAFPPTISCSLRRSPFPF